MAQAVFHRRGYVAHPDGCPNTASASSSLPCFSVRQPGSVEGKNTSSHGAAPVSVCVCVCVSPLSNIGCSDRYANECMQGGRG